MEYTKARRLLEVGVFEVLLDISLGVTKLASLFILVSKAQALHTPGNSDVD